MTAATFDEVDQENDFEPDDFGREIDALEKMLEPRPLEEAPGTPAPSPEADEKRQFFLDSLTAPPSLHAHLEEQLNESGLDEARRRRASTSSATWTRTAGWRRTWRRCRGKSGFRRRPSRRRWRRSRSSIRRGWRRGT